MKLDLTNQHFGRLIAKKPVGKCERGILWECLCSCGNSINVAASVLRYGSTKSCGCLGLQRLAEGRVVTHNMTNTPTYRSYRSMLARCTDSTHQSYARYGGAGVIVCPEWLVSFENFLQDMGIAPEGTTLDRLDGKKGYSKENCRWATKVQQYSNMKSNVFLEFEGKQQTMVELAHRFGVTNAWLRNNTLQMNRSIADLFIIGKLPYKGLSKND